MEKKYDVKANMTVISRNNMGFFEQNRATPQEMIEFLKSGAKFRSFVDILKKVYPQEDLEKRLKKGMCEIAEEDKKESMRKNAGNWLKGKNVPQSRETLFQICFVLQLNEEQAYQLLANADGTGIHYRNPQELVYAYCLRTGKTWQDALRLREEMLEIYHRVQKEKEISAEEAEEIAVYTQTIRNCFQNVMNEEELRTFFEEHAGELGVIHETAYHKFMELLNLLQRPEDENLEEGKSGKEAMAEVARDYINLGMPTGSSLRGYSMLQKLIKKYWPAETELNNMKTRSIDVSRKAMILLYLATESFDDEISTEESEEENDWDYYMDDEEEDEDTIWEIRIRKMDLFLEMYGMNLLDFGSPFDLLVIYSMRSSPWDSGLEEALLKKMKEEGRTELSAEEMHLLMEDDASKRMESLIRILYDDILNPEKTEQE